MNEMSPLPDTAQVEFTNDLRVRDGLTRLSAIVAPDAKMERMLFGFHAGQKLEFEQICQITDWFEPRLEAFLNDKVLRKRLNEMVSYYGNPSYRVYVRRFLLRDSSFDKHQARQSGVLRAAGASTAVINGVVGLQWITRLEFVKRQRLYYPTWVEVEKMLERMKQAVKSAREFLAAGGKGTTELDAAIGRDWLALCSLAANAVLGGEARDSMTVLLAHSYFAKFRTVRVVLMDA